MLLDTAYILSYFGNDEVREKRKEFHKRQLEWLFSQKPDMKVVIYAQGYKPEDFIKQDNIRYIVNEGALLPPGPARNMLLKDFYSSDNDYGLFMDNDSVLYEHYEGKDIINFINDRGKEFLRRVDCFYPLDPRKKPFRKYIEQNKDMFEKNFVLNNVDNLKTSLFFLKNLRKHFDKDFHMKYNGIEELYFDEEFEVLEDVDFGFCLVITRRRVYEAPSLILKEFAVNDSTLFKDDKSRNKLNRMYKDKLYEKYKSWGLEYRNGRLKKKGLFKNAGWWDGSGIVIPKEESKDV